MKSEQVRVLFYGSVSQTDKLEFSLIFADNSEKYYNFDEYGIRAFRGLNERDIVEQCAREYFEDMGQPTDIIELIFL